MLALHMNYYKPVPVSHYVDPAEARGLSLFLTPCPTENIAQMVEGLARWLLDLGS